MTLGDILVGPVNVLVSVRCCVPGDVVSIVEVLRDVQGCAANVTSTIEHAAVVVGAHWRMATSGTPRIEQRRCLYLFEVLRAMGIERLSTVRDIASTIHGVMSVAGSIGSADTTEVDVVHVALAGDPDVVEVLDGYSGTLCNRSSGLTATL